MRPEQVDKPTEDCARIGPSTWLWTNVGTAIHRPGEQDHGARAFEAEKYTVLIPKTIPQDPHGVWFFGASAIGYPLMNASKRDRRGPKGFVYIISYAESFTSATEAIQMGEPLAYVMLPTIEMNLGS